MECLLVTVDISMPKGDRSGTRYRFTFYARTGPNRAWTPGPRGDHKMAQNVNDNTRPAPRVPRVPGLLRST